MRLPTWLYELMPYLYAALGAVVLVKVDSALGYFSGAMLIIAGLLIRKTRQVYRSAARQTRAWRAPSREPTPAPRHPALVRLIWRREYECGIGAIDNEHRKLFALGNTLLNAILERKTKLDIELLLDDLVREITDHFCTEETLLARSRHPLSPTHQAIHHELMARCKTIAKDFHDEKLDAGDVFQFVAIDVVAEHIIKEDLKFLANVPA